MDLIWFAVIAGIIGLGFVVYLVSTVLKKDMGSKRVIEITSAIEERDATAMEECRRTHNPLSRSWRYVVVYVGDWLRPGLSR